MRSGFIFGSRRPPVCMLRGRHGLDHAGQPRSLPHVAVLAFNEIPPEITVEAVALVGLNG